MINFKILFSTSTYAQDHLGSSHDQLRGIALYILQTAKNTPYSIMTGCDLEGGNSCTERKCELMG